MISQSKRAVKIVNKNILSDAEIEKIKNEI